MFPLAHLGITFGGILVLHKAAALTVPASPQKKSGVNAGGNPSGSTDKPSQVSSPVTWIDYRLILLGSMLPDILDKPLGIWLHISGRAIAHTLVFAVVLVAAGFTLFAWRRSTGLLCLAFASGLHLVLDQMWLAPSTLFWPAYGWSFAPGASTEWWGRWLNSLISNPDAYVPEITGGLLLGVLFFYLLIRRGMLYKFLRTGAIG